MYICLHDYNSFLISKDSFSTDDFRRQNRSQSLTFEQPPLLCKQKRRRRLSSIKRENSRLLKLVRTKNWRNMIS